MQKNVQRFHWVLYVDGAARSNPGKAGVGIALYRDDVIIVQQGFYLGTRTNNQAEYIALLLGLGQMVALMSASDYATIYSDSELLVKQVQRVYVVKDSILKLLHRRAIDMMLGLDIHIEHVRRELNTVADALANRGIDDAVEVPQVLWHACIPSEVEIA